MGWRVGWVRVEWPWFGGWAVGRVKLVACCCPGEMGAVSMDVFVRDCEK